MRRHTRPPWLTWLLFQFLSISICYKAITAMTTRQFPSPHKAWIWITSQFIQPATIHSLENCQLSPAAPLHITSLVSGASPPNHLMWFLVPEQKQQCQQSYLCSCCSLNEDNFSVFTDMHLHNSFSPQSSPYCQEKLPQITNPRRQTFFFFFFKVSQMICCFAPKWLSVSLFRNNRFLALGRSCQWYFHDTDLVSVVPLTTPSLNKIWDSIFILTQRSIPMTYLRAQKFPQVSKLPASRACFHNKNALSHSAATLIMLAWMGLKLCDLINTCRPPQERLTLQERKEVEA